MPRPFTRPLASLLLGAALPSGDGGGMLQPGRHVRFAKDTPMTNLFLALLGRMNAPTERVGDSTGVLQGLA